MDLKKITSAWLPVVLWAALIFYLSSIPNLRANRDPLLDEFIRSVVHGVFYFIFTLLWWRALPWQSLSQKILGVLFFVFLYSLSDEIHQSFVPTRTFQIGDLVIDNLGSLCGVIFLYFVVPILPVRFRKLAERYGLLK